MKNTVITFIEKNRAELLEKDILPIKDNEILVKTLYSVISAGTERANITGEVNISVRDFSTVAVFPRYGGYSSSGIVLEKGANVRSVNIGDRVAMSWSVHSAYQVLPEENVHKIELDTIRTEDAAFAHISTFPMAAIRKCHFEIGQSAIVMGLGILGQIAVMLLHAGGAYPVIAVNRGEERRLKSINLGADYALDPSEEDFRVKTKDLTHGGANVAVEVTGNGSALDTLLDCMRPLSSVALCGCTRKSDFTIDYYHKVHGPGISLIGAHTLARPIAESAPYLWTTHDDAMTFLRLAGSGRIDASILRDRMCSPVDAPEIYTQLSSGRTFPVTEFDWNLL